MAFFVHLLLLFAIEAIVVVGLNLVAGFAGMLSVAQAVFYAIGAYSVGILSLHGWNFFLAMIVGALIAALFAAVTGFIFARLSGDYYVLGTVALNYIALAVFLNWESLTNGALGLAGSTVPVLFGFPFGGEERLLMLALFFLILAFFVARAIARSSFGRVLKAIREDEGAIQVFGYKTLHYKVLIFVVGAVLAAVGGALYMAYLGYIEPSSFTVMDSIVVLAMLIVGGLGSLGGSLVGPAIIVALPEVLRFFGFPSDIAAYLRQLSYGLLLVLFMLYRPKGIMGEYKL